MRRPDMPNTLKRGATWVAPSLFPPLTGVD